MARAFISIVTGALLVNSIVFSTFAAQPKNSADPNAAQFDQLIEKSFSENKFPSVVVGVVRGNALVYTKALGEADKSAKRVTTLDTFYRIGSVTKVFTSTVLAGLREQGVVKLDDPIAEYLPEHVKVPTDPRGEAKIRLWHLATHTSGLPRQPINVQPNGTDAYNNYSEELLYEGLTNMRLENPVGATMQYSNLGVGLLGHVLSRAAKKPYRDLVREMIFDPLEMKSTTFELSDEQRKIFSIAYGDDGNPAGEWNLGVLEPAGGIYSTLNDMAKFVSWQLKAGQPDVKPLGGGALQLMQNTHAAQDDFKRCAGLGWLIRPPQNDEPLIIWHNGGTAGHRSSVMLSPAHGVGVIVLTNCGKQVDSLAKDLMLAAIKTYGEENTEPVDPELMRIAKALVPFFVPEPSSGFEEYFHPSFLAEVPADQIRPILVQLATENGPAQGVTVERTDSNFEGIARYRFENNQEVRIQLIIDAGNPARIVGALVLPG
ncbi:MAG: serine hydrolase domain-containing protein [Phycisphaerae bacterium]